MLDLDSSPDALKIGSVGAKVFGYAHLRKIAGPGAYVVKANGIPLGTYLWFVKTYGLDAKIKSFLADAKSLDANTRNERLAELRSVFVEAVQNPEFLKSL